MRVAVSGSSGFVGAVVTKALRAQGLEVIEIDLRTGIDLTAWESAQQVGDFDVLVHLAGRSFVPESFERPRDFYHDNLVAALNALEMCRLRKAAMLHTSSYVYGIPQYLPINEEHPVCGFNPYSQSKLLTEGLCEGYWRDFGVPVVITRPFNIYGPGQNREFLIPTIVEQARRGKIVLRDPKPRRDLLHVDDLAAAYLAIIRTGIEGFDVVNFGAGVSYSVAELAELAAAAAGGPVEIEYTYEERPSEVADTVADIGKAKRRFRWEPRIPVDAGLAAMLQIHPTDGGGDTPP